MSRAALLLILPVLISCSKKEEPAADTTAAMAPEAAAPAPAAMNVAGKWNMRVMPDGKDTTILTYMLEATNENTGWKMTLPNRPTMDLRVIAMSADSIVTENGPYSSALRKNVMVTTHSSMHMDGDKIVGTTTARYATKGADSVVQLRMEGTRQ
ncbi:MAG: hypothetical protein ABIZ36_05385 [Gemmatimonadaceae bacterium]